MAARLSCSRFRRLGSAPAGSSRRVPERAYLEVRATVSPGRLQRLEEYIVLDLADDDLIDDRGVDVIRGRLGNLTHAGPSKENRT